MLRSIDILALAAALASTLPTCVLAAPKHAPPDCFELALPKQNSDPSILGIGVSQGEHVPGKALNEVELRIWRDTSAIVNLSLSAIRDVHFLFPDEFAHRLLSVLAEVLKLDGRLARQGRDRYEEPLLEVPVVDSVGKRQVLVFGISRTPRWNCYTNGKWTSPLGDAQTLLVLRMPFALEYSPSHTFTGMQFDLEAVAKLARTLKQIPDARSSRPGART